MLNTAVIPKLILLAEVDSTNNYTAKLLNSQKLTHGTVILAEKQTAGRGQRGNTWSSRENQFTGSFFLDTAFLSAAGLPLLNFAVALAVRAAVEEFSGVPAKIKWPNDILVNDRKISGILIETQWQGSSVKGTIAGIGLNLLREDGLEKAAFLEDLCENVPSAVETAVKIWSFLAENLSLLKSGRGMEISASYQAHLWRKGILQEAELADGSRIKGVITGVCETGNLEFLSDDRLRSFGIQEIRFFY